MFHHTIPPLTSVNHDFHYFFRNNSLFAQNLVAKTKLTNIEESLRRKSGEQKLGMHVNRSTNCDLEKLVREIYGSLSR